MKAATIVLVVCLLVFSLGLVACDSDFEIIDQADIPAVENKSSAWQVQGDVITGSSAAETNSG